MESRGEDRIKEKEAIELGKRRQEGRGRRSERGGAGERKIKKGGGETRLQGGEDKGESRERDHSALKRSCHQWEKWD